MRVSEQLAAAYAIVFVGAGLLACRSDRRALRSVALGGAGVSVAVLAPWVASLGGELLRSWWLLAFLPLAYWMPAPIVGRPHERLEAWLLRVDRAFGLGPVVPAFPLELSYLLVYPFVPAGLLAVLDAGGISADRFWLGVLLAVLPCYGLLPLAATRPPRALLVPSAGSKPGLFRHLNVRFLALFGNQWNTLPSGHAAGSVAVAVLVWAAGSPFAPLTGMLAIGICIGTISGRYHYVVDTVLGVGLGLAAAGVAMGPN
jgi:hypothetical protein